MEKVVIVGGGISGLAAGFYARMCGFECELYEGHIVTGGQCTGWNRNGYHIDNCVHWMTGTSPDKEIYKVWQDVGVLGNDIDIIQHKLFLRVDDGKNQLNLWQDLDVVEKEMLNLAPEDAKPIKHFVKMLRDFSNMELPAIKPPEQMTFMDKMRLLKKIWRVIPHAIKFNSVALCDYAKRFKNETVRSLVLSYLPSNFNTISVIYMYATFVCGNGAIPRGGSQAMSKRMEEKFLSLGGKVFTRHKATSIDVENGKATRVHFANNEVAEGDHIICACDTAVTFKLIGEQYMDDFFKKRYNDRGLYPVFSNFNTYISVDVDCSALPDMIIFKCDPFEVAGRLQDEVILKNFSYEPSFSPEGKNIMQTLTVQNENEFSFWADLYKDKDAYKAEKMRVANAIIKRIEEHFPDLVGHLAIVETVSPYSFYRFCGAYHGAYMSFISTHKTKRETHSGRLPGIDNLYLAGQWIQPPGGLPNALVAGRFAIQRLCKHIDVPFVD